MSSVSHEKIKTPEAIQCYAYEHFLMTDIIDEEYSDFYVDRFVVEAEENFYSKAEAFLIYNKIDSIALQEIAELVGKV